MRRLTEKLDMSSFSFLSPSSLLPPFSLSPFSLPPFSLPPPLFPQILPLCNCSVTSHENCDNPELSYRAIKIVLKEDDEEPETHVLLAGSITEKAEWLGDFAQVGGRGLVGHVTSLIDHMIQCN